MFENRLVYVVVCTVLALIIGGHIYRKARRCQEANVLFKVQFWEGGPLLWRRELEPRHVILAVYAYAAAFTAWLVWELIAAVIR